MYSFWRNIFLKNKITIMILVIINISNSRLVVMLLIIKISISKSEVLPLAFTQREPKDQKVVISSNLS